MDIEITDIAQEIAERLAAQYRLIKAAIPVGTWILATSTAVGGEWVRIGPTFCQVISHVTRVVNGKACLLLHAVRPDGAGEKNITAVDADPARVDVASVDTMFDNVFPPNTRVRFFSTDGWKNYIVVDRRNGGAVLVDQNGTSAFAPMALFDHTKDVSPGGCIWFFVLDSEKKTNGQWERRTAPRLPEPTKGNIVDAEPFNCPVCLEFFGSARIHSCIEGHSVCESCFVRMPKKDCPSCRKPVGGRNRALEAVMAAVVLYPS